MEQMMVCEEVHGESFFTILRCGDRIKPFTAFLEHIKSRADKEALFALKLCELLTLYPRRGHVCELVAKADFQHYLVSIWFCNDACGEDDPAMAFFFSEIMDRSISSICDEISKEFGI